MKIEAYIVTINKIIWAWIALLLWIQLMQKGLTIAQINLVDTLGSVEEGINLSIKM